MSIIFKQLTLIFFGLLPLCVSAACFPPELIIDAVERIDMFVVGDDSETIESRVTRGERAGTTFLRLSRLYYEITIVDDSYPSFSSTGILLGSIREDTSILDGGPGVIQMTSFVAERKDLDIQLVCMDYSILSEQLLREEIVTLIQRAG